MIISGSMQNKKQVWMIILLLPALFLYFPAMYAASYIPAYSIIIGFTYLFLIPYVLFNLKYYSKYKFFRLLEYFILWAILSGLFLVAIGIYKPVPFILGIIIYLLYNNILWYLYPSCIFPKIFSLKTLIKICTIAIYLISFWGVLNYLLNHLFGVDTSCIQDILVSRHLIDEHQKRYLGERLNSVFEEPGFMGGFICVNLPIIYKMAESKFKFFKNKYLNKFFKMSYVPLILITIVLVQSPIWIIFFFIATFAYITYNKFKYFKNLKVIITIFIASLILLASSITFFQNSKIDLSKTFLNRIKIVTNALSSFEILVNAEQSLGQRLISYNIRFIIFSKYPITGAGYRNSERCALPVLNHINYTVTRGIIKSANDALQKNDSFMILNSAILWSLLSDTGIVGTILFYLFVIFSILKINKMVKNMPPGLERDFMEGVKLSYVAIIGFSIYDLRINLPYFWFLFGLTPVFTRYYNEKFLKKD